MSHLKITFCGACLALASISATAQQDYPVLPVEMFGCSYLADKDASDADAADARFNRWADGKGITSLTSVRLTPHFFSTELEFEVVAMDIWDDGAAFGSGASQIGQDPSGVAGYDEVGECSAHGLYALVGIKPPADGLADGGLLEFTDCTMKENRTPDDGIAAAVAIGNLMGEMNIGDAQGIMFPVSGETPDADYTFKWITYYPSVAAFGSAFDQYSAGGVQRANAIINPVMECNHSRMYDVHVVREAQEAE